MTEDLATLGILVDSSQVTPAVAKLDTLTAAGARAEASTGKLTSATQVLLATQKSGGAITSQMIKDVGGWSAAQQILQNDMKATAKAEAETASARIVGEQAAATAAVEGAAVTVAAHEAVAGSSIKVRESLVMLREAARGNWTRLAGSATILAGAFGVLYSVLIPVGVVLAALGAGFLVATQQINEGSGDLTKGLGLTAEQLDKVKQRTVTFMDTVKATGEVLGDRIANLFPAGTMSLVQKGWDDLVRGTEIALITIVELIPATASAIAEAWKSMPTWLGGEGKSFSFDNVKNAFVSTITSAISDVDKFLGDIETKAQSNARDRIKKEAGKAPGGSVSEADRATGTLQQLQDETAAQKSYNDALASGASSVAEIARQESIDNGVKSLVVKYNADVAAGTAKSRAEAEKLGPIIAALRVAYGQAYDEKVRGEVIRQTLALQDQNAVLQLQIDLAGQSNDVRAIAIAQLKELQYLQQHHTDPNSKEGRDAMAAVTKNTQLGLDNSRAALKNAAGDKGQSMGTAAAQATLASDPQAYIKQQTAAYAEIDKLRKLDVLSETQAAQAKAKVNAEIDAQRLQDASDFFGNLASLSSSSNKTLAEIGKAAAITQASIDGVLAVQKALAAYPPPYNYIMAAGVGVAAAANVAKIAGFADGGYIQGPGGPRDDKVLLWGSNGEFMVNATATARNRSLLEAINSGKQITANGNAPTHVAGSSGNGMTLVIEHHGTPQTYAQVPGLSANEVRLIARDEDHKNVPTILTRETGNANSSFRKRLKKELSVPRRMGG